MYFRLLPLALTFWSLSPAYAAWKVTGTKVLCQARSDKSDLMIEWGADNPGVVVFELYGTSLDEKWEPENSNVEVEFDSGPKMPKWLMASSSKRLALFTDSGGLLTRFAQAKDLWVWKDHQIVASADLRGSDDARTRFLKCYERATAGRFTVHRF